ncbi:MerR family transcriptional regulator [Aquabacterium sp.]|uniref:MerR family transcriptional regulator n=1 Tax=Aquabacterium sp. TaxID=1872578 RepID=UPI0035B01FC6
MSGPTSGAPISLPISAVERDTGLSKDTLRVWERRYGFPTPQRDAQGERLYPFEQLEKLRLIRRLLDAGHRPGRVVAQPAAQLRQLIERLNQPFDPAHPRAATPSPATQQRELHRLLEHVQALDAHGLRRDLSRAAARGGLHAFIFDVAGPLLNEMHAARLRGALQRYQELWARECLENALRQELAALPPPPADARPRMVLATLPNESRGLGRLMMQGLATLHGVECLSLGQQVPVPDIAEAASGHRADIVGICFSADGGQAPLRLALLDLRNRLDPSVELWVASTHIKSLKQPIQGVQVLTQPTDIETLTDRWRDQHQVCV